MYLSYIRRHHSHWLSQYIIELQTYDSDRLHAEQNLAETEALACQIGWRGAH